MKRSKPIRKVSSKQAAKQRAWNKITEEKAIRLNGLCERCGKAPDFRGLSGHHIVKRSLCGVYTEDNHMLLCGKCHSFVHGIKER